MSCLFNSLSYFVKEDTSISIRNKICDYLLGNNELIDGMSTSDIILYDSGVPLQIYVQRMRNTSTWGGAIEIMSFVKIFNIKVKVLVLNSNSYIEFHCNTDIEIRISWNGSHYEPII
jgi:hypothetical protein